MHVDALTVDLDDTLWPYAAAAEAIAEAVAAVLAEHAPAAPYDLATFRRLAVEPGGPSPAWHDEHDRLRTGGLAELLAGVPARDEVVAAALGALARARQTLPPYADALPALRRLAARWPVVAVTNGSSEVAPTPVAPLLADVVTAREAGVRKPAPGIFRLACDRLGLPPERVLHVGDQLAVDVEGALGAGLQAAWVDRRGDLAPTPPGALRVPDLGALADRLGA